MNTRQATLLVIIIILFIQMFQWVVESRPGPTCPPCPVGGCPIPTECTYGVVEDNCGRSRCGKGPGERCKIKRFRIQENCGEGLFCHCGQCQGCSTHTFDCYENTCVIPMSSG